MTLITDYRKVLDFKRQHLEEKLDEAQRAVKKFTDRAAWDRELISEFTDSDPEVAEIYREWERFHLDKVTYFQAIIDEVLPQLVAKESQL